jgi:hypothetical protein
MLKRTDYIATRNKGGGVVLVSALLVGGTRNADKPESKYGLNAG